MTLQDLTIKKEKLNAFRPLSKLEVDELNRQLKFDHIWSSNAIEGNTLTKYETISVLETGLTVDGKPIKDYLEVLDLSQAYDFVESLATKKEPLSIS
ncbi:MAG: Fic family protein, partial [Lactobacillaceae bacterium]|nr:Fic family protein [Lactobacillaceae bacterium]